MEKSHLGYKRVNKRGLEFILDYNEDRSSDEMKNVHAQIHIETIGK